MDGVGGQSREVLVMAATNRFEALDAALVRPGRIDKSFQVGFPSVKDKEAILLQYTKHMPLAQDVDIAALAKRFTGIRHFTGADLAAVCKEAAFRALRENLDAMEIPMRFFVQAWDQRLVAALKQH
jgi:transitional endoplasmic reticulum ATPase